MKTASVWIVTYNNPPDLENNLHSLFSTVDEHKLDLEVNVINNHSNFKLSFSHGHRVKVWHNSLRMDSSLGHLSRNWNQAIMQGFVDLNSPRVDYVITSQDDMIWQPHWCDHFLDQMTTYSLVSHGWGDGVVCYTPLAVKNIGMWDERFSPSFYHEGDYFLRALMYNKPYTSINDPAHGRILNPVEFQIAVNPTPNQNRNEAKHASYTRAHIPFCMWTHKWSCDAIHWSPELIDHPPHASRCENYVLYPHFELAVENLREKNYII